ncbi:MAG TPA: ABC transporter permease [Hyphomicrobiaceae bacterium]|jgi:peptide/nickel transport system permease protein|nr:ABC transporter permease [Hyphomicrobiaceae bacterium]
MRDAADSTAPSSAAGTIAPARRRRLAAFLDSDLLHSFLRSRLVVLAALISGLIVGAAVLAPLIAPHDPYDLKSLSLLDANTPPAWEKGGDPNFLLGTDDQGRDILSTILYGTRSSLAIGLCSILLASALGLSLGLWAGYVGGRVDTVIMRIADVQLTFPAILTALLIDGVALAILRHHTVEGGKFSILVLAIGLSFWVQYARTVRGVTLVERNKEYVEAARLIGIGPLKIMFQHILPNVLGPVLVIATINLALAIITEATLSFLGVGLPPTEPSLGTMIQVGNKYLFSGSWWMVAFPGLTLALLALAVNLLGDWLRDALNPKLR